MFSSCNGEADADTVVDKKVQGGLCAKAIPKDPCVGTDSDAVVNEADMTTNICPEPTVDSMSEEIAKSLEEHYAELTQYAVIMSGIIDKLNKKVDSQIVSCQEQKMVVEECYNTETREPLNCLGLVQQFVQCVQDCTESVFDPVGHKEEDDYNDDDDCF